jgi:hypothetical protein
MIRWFLFITSTKAYAISSEDNIIVYVGKEGDKDWLGKSLQEIKPEVVKAKTKVLELKPQSQ